MLTGTIFGTEISYNAVVFHLKSDSGNLLSGLSLHHAWAQVTVRTSQGIQSTAVLACLYKPTSFSPQKHFYLSLTVPPSILLF